MLVIYLVTVKHLDRKVERARGVTAKTPLFPAPDELAENPN